jgi:hypothetical protein
MRVLLDNGIISHAEFAEGAIQEKSVRWGPRQEIARIHGLVRKRPGGTADYQRQKEGIFTIGRLIREGKIEAYTYSELHFERIRGRIGVQNFNALNGCTIKWCQPALERSKFLKSLNFQDVIAKGGKNDRKSGKELGEANQISFFKQLCALNREKVEAVIASCASIMHLTEFEIDSLRSISWFQFLCTRSGIETYPDIFHLWTAERNGLDVFLTLDNDLPDLISRVNNEKKSRVAIKTEVLRPHELLRKLGIDRPDPVPMEADRFYRIF